MESRIVSVADEFFRRTANVRGFKAWKYCVADGLRKAQSKRRGVKAFMNSGLKKGWNGWVALMLERATALARLRAAVAGFRNRSLRKGMNTLIEARTERLAKLAKLKLAARSLFFRQQRKVWNKLAAGAKLLRKARTAMRSFTNRNMRMGFNGWQYMMVERAAAYEALHKAGSAFRSRGERKGFNELLAAREERKRKLAGLERGARAFLYSAVRKALNKLMAGLRLIQLARKAGAAFQGRLRRRGLNGWMGYMHDKASTSARVRLILDQALRALKMRRRRVALNSWKEMILDKALGHMSLRSAVAAFMLRGMKAAFNSLADRSAANGFSHEQLRRARQLFVARALVGAFYLWIDRARERREDAAKPRPRPTSPLAKKRAKWAAKRVSSAHSVEVAADDKFQCQRVLHAPHAALVLRADGTVLRVVAIHRPPNTMDCTVDLSCGYDVRMLDDVPLPDYQDPRSNPGRPPPRPMPVDVRVSVAALSAPEHPLIVPQFFGGRLGLSNGLDVRVLDCAFAPSERPFFGLDDDQPRPPVLRRVLLTLIDGQGVAVGQPAWVELLELLELLRGNAVVTAQCAAEDELRRRRRVELHIVEQRKLALHHLRLARKEAAKEGRGSHASPATHAPHGIEHLVRQLADAAPSAYLNEENQANPRADAFVQPRAERIERLAAVAKGRAGHQSASTLSGGHGGFPLKVVDL